MMVISGLLVTVTLLRLTEGMRSVADGTGVTLAPAKWQGGFRRQARPCAAQTHSSPMGGRLGWGLRPPGRNSHII